MTETTTMLDLHCALFIFGAAGTALHGIYFVLVRVASFIERWKGW